MGDHASPPGHVGLEQIIFGHGTTPDFEHGSNGLHQRIVTLQWHVHHLRECGSSDVVLRRPESPADDDRVAARQRRSKSQNDPLVVVTNVLVEVRRDAVRGELFAQPLRIGVRNLPEQQFAAYRDDLNSHESLPFGPGRNTERRCRGLGPRRSKL